MEYVRKIYKNVPFSEEMAMKIFKGEVPGRITTNEGLPVRILCFDKKTTKTGDNKERYQIVALVSFMGKEYVTICGRSNGRCWDCEGDGCWNLCLYIEDACERNDAIFSDIADIILSGKASGKFTLNDGTDIPSKQLRLSGSDAYPYLLDGVGYLYKENGETAYAFGDGKWFNIIRFSEDVYLDPSNDNLSNSETTKTKKLPKPFDRVLVMNPEKSELCISNYEWVPAILQYKSPNSSLYFACGKGFSKCIPYEGNEDLVGTNKKPNIIYDE